MFIHLLLKCSVILTDDAVARPVEEGGVGDGAVLGRRVVDVLGPRVVRRNPLFARVDLEF